MPVSRPLALSLLGAALVFLLSAGSMYLCVAFSTGPFEPLFGAWARQTNFVTYRGGSSANEPKGQFWIILLFLLGAGCLLAGWLMFAAWRYWRDHPDED